VRRGWTAEPLHLAIQPVLDGTLFAHYRAGHCAVADRPIYACRHIVLMQTLLIGGPVPDRVIISPTLPDKVDTWLVKPGQDGHSGRLGSVDVGDSALVLHCHCGMSLGLLADGVK